MRIFPPVLLARWVLAAAMIALTAAGAGADGPADNQVDHVRSIPPPGITLSAGDRQELSDGVSRLGQQIDALSGSLKSRPSLLSLLPDVRIYYNAVRYALAYNEFFSPREVDAARGLLREGMERASELSEGKPLWPTAAGLVVRGYVSRIDDSVQPYGLVVPPTYSPLLPHRYRLDVWFHGRDETLSEVNFLSQRERSPGEFTPDNTIVLHTYGRYCNGQRFAGETDLFEALDDVRRRYPIDENRILVRGFSLGGAACWHIATHHSGLWAAAAPGAGFSETAGFLNVFQNEKLQPTWYEQKLWHLYDSTDYAVNLFNCPTVAYSGGIDPQKQAADEMARALAKEGMTLTHVIGPNTRHSYEPHAKQEVIRRVEAIAARGRNPIPHHIRFTTWTLRYNQMLWLTVDALTRHWERARVDADIVDDHTVRVRTGNVEALTLSMAPGLCPLDNTRPPVVELDGDPVSAAPVMTDRSWDAHFHRAGRRWAAGPLEETALRKRHGLQGPIDDAFMDSFLMVRPTGKPANDTTSAWVQREMAHAITEWRRQFRGEALVKDDTAVTDDDIASRNLVLWGDPSSNRILSRIAGRLPVRWTTRDIQVGGHSYAADHNVPLMIYPNPLNPQRYVVLNSGFTFREYDYLNNARQTPKLPDYAIVDVNVPATSRSPGGVVDAGFFGEHWELLPNSGR